MSANFLWSTSASNGWLATASTLLSTEMNSLANSTANTLSTLGGAVDNTTNRYELGYIEFLAGGTMSPAANAFLELWFLMSMDGGTNYEDGSASVAPGRPADLIIPVRAGTTITPRAGRFPVVIPPGFFKPILRNQTGVALPASGNTLKVGYIAESY